MFFPDDAVRVAALSKYVSRPAEQPSNLWVDLRSAVPRYGNVPIPLKVVAKNPFDFEM